jgi:hypothetical protein
MTVLPGMGGPAPSLPGSPPGHGPAGSGGGIASGLALTGIGAALLIMIAVSVAGPSRAVVRFPAPAAGPPWWVPLHPPVGLVTGALLVAVITGAAGVGAGLVAVARGERLPARWLVGAALAAAAVFAVLPPAGSTDTLDYAAYGRMVVAGHDPYVMTPRQLQLSGDPVGAAIPKIWSGKHSIYGPLATMEEAAAAAAGGTSPAAITFWLKLWNALAFGAVVLALDRLLCSDPAARARAHLLWSVNPLLLWGLLAGGHVDTVAAGIGLAGLLVAGRLRDGGNPAMVRAGMAGVLVGAATDIKIPFILFGLGIAWAARRSMRLLVAASAGALLVLMPSYLWFGWPAVRVLLYRDASATSDNLYQLLARPFNRGHLPDLMLVVVPLLVMAIWLLLRRLPPGFPGSPAVRPALGLSLAWLLVWPYQRPWYDAMAFCLLALYPASRLDWPVLARLTAGTVYYLPGMPGRLTGELGALFHEERVLLVPVLRFAALAAVITLCVTGAWRSTGPGAGGRWGMRRINGQTPGGDLPAPAARAPAGAAPAPGSGGAGQPGTPQQGRG